MIQLVPIVLAQVALLAGAPVDVQCSPNLGQDTWGKVDGANSISLIDFGCQDVNRFSRTRRLPRSVAYKGMTHDRGEETVDSLMILVHETGHIRHPDWSESCVQRFALRHLPLFVRRLGASQEMTRRIDRIAARESLSMPPEYQSACTKG